MKARAEANTAEKTAVRCSTGTVKNNGRMPTAMTRPPIIASRGGRRENSPQPRIIAMGMATRTSRLPVVGVMCVSVR